MKSKIIKLLATSFGLGNAPVAPGTFGSLPGLLIAWYLSAQSQIIFWVVATVIAITAIVVSQMAEEVYASKDAQTIVIDEVAGQVLTFFLVPALTWPLILVGFIAFRFFDVVKLPPANWAQDKLPGGWGVAGDDLIAGLQAGVVLYLVQLYVFPYFGW